MSDEIFIGCDPGVNGAVAAIGPNRQFYIAEPFPITETPKTPVRRERINKQTGKKEKYTSHGKSREFDFFAVAQLFDKIAQLPGYKHAIVEKVSSMPRDAKAAAFTFGGSYWAIRQALADRGIPFELVTPKAWQGEMLQAIPHGDRTAIRAAYRAKARTMFPEVDLSKAKHADKAAALLLAEYCRRQFVRQ